MSQPLAERGADLVRRCRLPSRVGDPDRPDERPAGSSGQARIGDVEAQGTKNRLEQRPHDLRWLAAQPAPYVNSAYARDSTHAAPLRPVRTMASRHSSVPGRGCFGIAYRILGSAAEAEDLVQDVWVRWQTTDRSAVRNPLAFLVTATTRLAIDELQPARAEGDLRGLMAAGTVDTSAGHRGA